MAFIAKCNYAEEDKTIVHLNSIDVVAFPDLMSISM